MYILTGNGRIFRGFVASASLLPWGVYIFIHHDGLDDMPKFDSFSVRAEEIGETVFESMEQAANVLKEKRKEI